MYTKSSPKVRFCDSRDGTPISSSKMKSNSTTNLTKGSIVPRKGVLRVGGSSLDVSRTPESIFNTAFSSNTSTVTSNNQSSAKKTPVSLFMRTNSMTSSGFNSPSSQAKSNSSGKLSSISSNRTSSSINSSQLLSTPKSTSGLKPKRALGSFEQQTSTPDCYSKVSMESPKRLVRSNPVSIENSLMNSTHDDTIKSRDGEVSNLTVAVRVRPMNSKELSKPSVNHVVTVEGSEVIVTAGNSADYLTGVTHRFQYDSAFWSCNPDHENYADQETVFRGTALPLIEKSFEGYNACLFAYGQTGSGKSYSMMGVDIDENYHIGPDSDSGIIPRFCQELFCRIDDLKGKFHAEAEISYFEIYNEKIHDLLAVSMQDGLLNSAQNPTKRPPLRVREHPIWGPYIVDLSTHPVDSHTSIRNWLAVGNSQRATAATGMNDKSSRSHSIFNIVLNLSEINPKGEEPPQTKRSKISLVDLAGSERVHTSQTSASGDRLREGVSINKSLLTLGKVIAALADSKKGGNFVPYRESVLTWLLRENLGGNSRTAMLATISPANIHLDETLATLRYACQARTIVNRVKVNEDPHDRIIRELRAEVDRLHALHHEYERQKRNSIPGTTGIPEPRRIIIETSADENEVESLRQQLRVSEQELAKAQKSWMERLRDAEEIRKSEMRMLKRKGLALELSVEQKQPCLVNLAADPILSGTLLYLIPSGVVKIGRSRPSAFEQPDIVLDGPLVAYHHCSIEHVGDKLFLIPQNNEPFETFVNGELVECRRQLFHGDRMVIGGSHFFRVANPHCPNRKKMAPVVDYQTAYQEIIQQQEKRLRNELDQEKQAALSEIEAERKANEKIYNEKMERLKLEKFKCNISKELLETEKQALLESEKKKRSSFEYKPFQSTILDDIERILKKRSKETLHTVRLMVREATQRCQDMGMFYEFRQTHVADEVGQFKTIIKILDHENYRTAEWTSTRLEVWLDHLRENDENVTKDNLFSHVDIDWSCDDYNPDESCANLTESSFNSSKISLNLSAMKDAILGSATKSRLTTTPTQNSAKKTTVTPDHGKNGTSGGLAVKKILFGNRNENTPPKTPTSGSTQQRSSATKTPRNFDVQARGCVRDLQVTVNKLKNMCTGGGSGNDEKCKKIARFADEMELMINEMKSVLSDKEINLKNSKFFLE